MKELFEARNALLDGLEGIVKKAETEIRSFTEEEQTEFSAKKLELEKLDKTISAMQEVRSMEHKTTVDDVKTETREAIETRAFESYIRNKVETRADANLTAGDNGAVIPTSIANKIIAKVYDIAPLYQLATRYNVGGSLTIPYYDKETTAITMSYADEFTNAESTSGKFLSITLTGYLGRALTKVSLSLIQDSNFDIVTYVVNAMANSIARWVEKELINGTTGKITGLSGATNGVTQKVTAASSTAITADELIDLQEKIPDVYQAGAIFVMSKATRTAIRKLKDSDGDYLLNRDATAKWGYTLFGKDVYASSNMPDMAAGKDVIFYGDFSGLAIKMSEDINVQVLRETYAEQHCVGVLGFVRMDAKVENAQKLAKLTMKASS